MKAVVLGAGLVGGLIAADLSRDFEVTVIDLDRAALDRVKAGAGVETIVGSAVDPQVVGPATEETAVVAGAVPGRLGYQMLELLIDLGRNVADISFMPQDFTALDQRAKDRGVTVVPDFGVAPGMCHLLVGRAAHLLDEVDSAEILVGGIPANPKPPWNFKVVFSPEDTIDEYIRPARFVRDGREESLPALSELEEIDIPGVGRLEAFLTDGLRSLIKTIPARNMVEKTMRWPGHAQMMEALRQAGFFDPQPRPLAGSDISPLRATSELLFSDWQMRPDEGDRDLTVMSVRVVGRRQGQSVTYHWQLVDRFDEATGRHSMARTTGHACAAMARAIGQGRLTKTGVIAPELVADDDALFRFLLAQQAEQGVVYHQTVTTETETW